MFSRRNGNRFNRGRFRGRSASAASSSRFDQLVTSVPVLQSVQANAGVTLGTTMLAAGFTPPTVSLVGTPATPCGIFVEVNDTTGGQAVGNAKFRLSKNGSIVATGLTTAASVDISPYVGGSSAVQFSAGVYTNDNTYRSTVATWIDQSSGAKDYQQVSAAPQPVYGSSLLNGIPVLSFDGVDDYLESALVLPAAGTTPSYACFVARIDTWTNGSYIIGDSQSGSNFPKAVNMTGSSPTIQSFNGTAVTNNNMTVGNWFFGEVLWSNNASDFLKIGSAAPTTGSAGNLYTSAGRRIAMSGAAGSIRGKVSFAQLMYCQGAPNAGERTALRALVTSMFGAGVGV